MFAELLEFSQEFVRLCRDGGGSTGRYRKKWVQDPFRQWSRRWEYVYVAQRLSDWLEGRSGSQKVVDAGSGFTFFPFFLARQNPGLAIDCYDNDPTAGAALREAGELVGTGPAFHIEDLEQLSGDNETVDAVYSVSVIEHTNNPKRVIDEINRVLKPGGIFICTFDISFERQSPMHVRHVETLVDHIGSVFDVSTDWEPIAFDALTADSGIVSTAWDFPSIKAGLPWRNPMLVWAYDLLRGRFRTTLYRPLTFCCQTVRKKRG